MILKKMIPVTLLLFAAFSFPAFAQDSEEDNEEENRSPIISTWTADNMSLYTRGDQLFWINIGILIPLFVTDNKGDKMERNIKLGGAGSLAYSYFLNSHLYLGAELQGSFSVTKARKFMYMVPIAVKVGYQFLVSRFEFPLSVAIGGCSQTYDNTNNIYSMFIKPQASAFFRFNPEWSFGLNVEWWVVPQITKDENKKRTPQYDATGHFMEISLAARYHF
jgi:hypothetical protein